MHVDCSMHDADTTTSDLNQHAQHTTWLLQGQPRHLAVMSGLLQICCTHVGWLFSPYSPQVHLLAVMRAAQKELGGTVPARGYIVRDICIPIRWHLTREPKVTQLEAPYHAPCH